jgi:galactose-1-phosphate uridylyltransferase
LILKEHDHEKHPQERQRTVKRQEQRRALCPGYPSILLPLRTLSLEPFPMLTPNQPEQELPMKSMLKTMTERLSSKNSDSCYAPATRHYFFNYQR